MSLSMILGFLWVVAATMTALLPMRLQFRPGVTLLAISGPLILYIGYENGWWISVLALAAALSMFRRPLGYLARKAIGRLKEDQT